MQVGDFVFFFPIPMGKPRGSFRSKFVRVLSGKIAGRSAAVKGDSLTASPSPFSGHGGPCAEHHGPRQASCRIKRQAGEAEVPGGEVVPPLLEEPGCHSRAGTGAGTHAAVFAEDCPHEHGRREGDQQAGQQVQILIHAIAGQPVSHFVVNLSHGR